MYKYEKKRGGYIEIKKKCVICGRYKNITGFDGDICNSCLRKIKLGRKEYVKKYKKYLGGVCLAKEKRRSGNKM